MEKTEYSCVCSWKKRLCTTKQKQIQKVRQHELKGTAVVCTLARCQSLSRAAEELFISPSALSVYISNLEKYLGVRLFERTGRGKAFVLTSIGEEYVVRAEKMLELKAEFEGLVENELHRSHRLSALESSSAGLFLLCQRYCSVSWKSIRMWK